MDWKIKTKRIFSCLMLLVVLASGRAQNTVKPNVKAPNGFEVNSFSGNLYHQRTDMKMPSQGPDMEIVFSFNNTRRSRDWGMGPGWTFTFNMAYTTDSSGSIYIEKADGRRDYYRKVGNNYTPPPGVFDELTQYQPGRYQLKTKDNTRYLFDNATHKKLTQINDRNNNSIVLTYTDSLPVQITDAASRSYSLNWQAGRLASIQNNCASPVRKVSFVYDTAGNPITVINPAGDSVKYYYDRNNRIVAFSDANGYNMSMVYNANGSVEKIISCVTTQLFTYSPSLRKTFVTELVQGQRQITTYSYDTSGRVMHKEGNCCGYNMAYQYDAANNITKQTNGNNQAVKYQYDVKGNIIKETDALGNSTSYTWHPIWNKMTAVTDRRGNTTQYEYDAAGNNTKIIRPLGITELFAYDAKGNLLSQTDGNNNTTSYTYNPFGQLLKTTDALGGVTENIYDGCGNLAQVKDARNNSVLYEYDALNRLVKTTNALGQATVYTYDAEGNMKTMKDALGRVTSYGYDGLGRRVSTTSPMGNTTSVEYDERGNRVKLTDARGNSTQYIYNSRNQPLTETDAMGNTKAYEYDAAGNLLSETDKKGNTTRYQYDALNRLVKTTNADGATMSVVYDAEGNRIAATDYNGNTSYMEYDALNRPIKTTDPFNKTTVNTYDNNGNVTAQKDKSNNTWLTQYDKLNREIKITDPLGAVTETVYDANGNRSSMKNQLGHITSYTYDVLDRQLTETNPLNETTTYTYDSVGNVKTVASPNGNTVSNVYDADNRLVAVTDAIGPVSSYTYDANGNRVTEKDANNHTITYQYDALNRVVMIKDAMGFDAKREYDANGNTLADIDRNGNAKRYEYDRLNRRNKETNALGNSTRFEYDANGNRTRIVDAKGNMTSYAFDALNRLTRETYADGTNKAFSYDANGNRKTRKDNNGAITTYTYDAINRMIKRSYPGGLDETFSFDLAGRRLTANNANATISFTYDNMGRMLSETLNGKTTGYAYNTAARTRILTYPGGRVITEQRDQRERLTGITEGGNSIAGFIYDGADRLTKKTLGNGFSQNYVYDANNRVTLLDCQPNNVIDFRYTYDKEGNRLTALKNHRATHSEKYLYDNIYQLTGFYNGRLTGDMLNDTTSKNTYTYDALHNRITSVEDSITRTYVADNMNAYDTVKTNGVAVNYSYDANGNMLSDSTYLYQYDNENRLKAIIGIAQYMHDAIGRKIKKITNDTNIINYYYSNQVIEERNAADVIQKNFMYGLNLDDLLSYKSGGVSYYIFSNMQGSVQGTFAENILSDRYDYSGYGETKYYDANFQTVNGDFIYNVATFQGRYLLNTNLFDFRARCYQNRIGRFSQRDPVEFLDGLNLYAAYFIPNKTDPTGLYISKSFCDKYANSSFGYYHNMYNKSFTENGCPFPSITCDCCSEYKDGRAGYYNGNIVLCYKSISNELHLRGVVGHEMNHAVDFCNGFDRKNCIHIACSEIRSYSVEYSVYGITGENHKRLVSLMAAKSLATNPKCAKNSATIVNSVLNSCYVPN
jgi:RHS repeat-associated protein